MGEVLGLILLCFIIWFLWGKLSEWVSHAYNTRSIRRGIEKNIKKEDKEWQQIKEKRFKEFGVKRTLVDADNITAQELLDQLLELTKNNKIVALSKEILFEDEPDKILKISEKVPKEKVIQEWIWDAQPVNSSSYKLYILTTDEEKAYYKATSFLRDK